MHHNIYSKLKRENFTFDTTAYQKFDEKEAVFLGNFVSCWGHCLTDCLKFLWILFDDDYAFLKEKLFVYVAYEDTKNVKIPDNFFALIEKLGIQKNQLVKITSPTQFAKVYVPEPCFFHNTITHMREYTKEYVALIDKIKNQVQLTSDAKKIYLTRTALKTYGKDTGEKTIENLFRKNGYTIVSPEKCTLDEQIALFKNADIFAGTEGSITHNCIFMKKNAKLIILRKASYINGYQFALNQLVDADITYIDVHKSIMMNKKKHYLGPFFLYASKALCNFLNEKKQPFPLKTFLVYVLSKNKLGLIVCPFLARKIDKLENFLEPIIGDQVRAVKNFFRKLLKKHRA